MGQGVVVLIGTSPRAQLPRGCLWKPAKPPLSISLVFDLVEFDHLLGHEGGRAGKAGRAAVDEGALHKSQRRRRR